MKSDELANNVQTMFRNKQMEKKLKYAKRPVHFGNNE